MRVLSNADVAAYLDMKTAIDVVAGAMVKVSHGEAKLPLRRVIELGGGNLLGMMPGAMEEPGCFGVKLISLFPGNTAHGYSSHQGAMVLFEAEHGSAIAMMNADLLTAVRTAAASGVATRQLARTDATSLAILGNGEQAEHHLDAMLAVRDITHLRIAARSQEKADGFAAMAKQRYPQLETVAGTDIRVLVDGADIICTTTAAPDPILFGDWVSPGTHLNVIGSSVPTMREIDNNLIACARLYVDYRVSTFAQAGDVIGAIKSGRIGEDHVIGEIGEVLDGSAPGRGGPEEITLYRSLGIAAQDLACAHYVLQRAAAEGRGTEVDL